MAFVDNILKLWRAVYEVQPGVGALLAILAAYWLVTGIWNSVKQSRQAPAPGPAGEAAPSASGAAGQAGPDDEQRRGAGGTP